MPTVHLKPNRDTGHMFKPHVKHVFMFQYCSSLRLQKNNNSKKTLYSKAAQSQE